MLFFLRDDNRNLKRINDLCLVLALAVNMMMFEGLEVLSGSVGGGSFTGRRLKGHGGGGAAHNPAHDAQTGNMAVADSAISGVHYPNEGWKFAVRGAGWLYFALSMSSLWLNCLTYFPVDYQKALEDSKECRPRYLETAGTILLVLALVLALWFLKVPVVLPAGIALLCLRQLGTIWGHERRRCPRNGVAESLRAFHLSANRALVSRQIVLGFVCLAGVLQAEYFYTFLLLDVVNFSGKLQNVVKAVSNPLESLVLTSMLGTLVMYGYASYGYFFLRFDFEDDDRRLFCETFTDCIIYTVNTGLRQEGGMGMGLMQHPDSYGMRNDHLEVGRFIYDLSFFVLITTLFLNLLFGIIVDTFGSLRLETQSRETTMRNTAFVSCLERNQLDKSLSALGLANGFEWLEAVGQNKWSYMKFILHLRRKDPLTYTGPETAIMELVNNEDISWMPNSTCAMLQQEERRLHQEEAEQAAAAQQRAEEEDEE